MDQLKSFADQRLVFGCIYCGSQAGTRDHIPSRMLLDEPYPENLPVVPACNECNKGFSGDEEYLGCLIECVRTGSVEAVERDKVKRILTEKRALARRLSEARAVREDGEIIFAVEEPRVRNILLKLARGHVVFELGEPVRHDPSHVMFSPLFCLSEEARQHFEMPPEPCVWPEVGSRAMQRLATRGRIDWLIVQPTRYRYFVAAEGDVMVRIVIGEFLACEVIWDSDDG